MAGGAEAEDQGWIFVVTTTLVVVLGSVYVYRCVVRRNRRRKWRQAGENVVLVHCFRPGFFTPCVSPFVMKLLTYLRLAQIPYKVEHEEPKGKLGLSPWVTLNGEELTDSQIVIERLAQHYGKNFSKRLTEEQRAVAWSFTIMIDEHLCWCLREWRFKVDNGRTLVEGMRHLWYVHLFKYFFVESRKQTLWHQGIGRHTHSWAWSLTNKDLHALSSYLGKKSYLMGEEASEVDCSMFAFLSNIMYNYRRSPYYTTITEDCPNLKAYVKRVKERLWPDWNQCLDQS
ncbi:failed axon connections homolog isoform X1 [Procambarus clarkii]|uniref:failed axon connections homolog isoform X1 n=2 Tax=Procambarus clarkii TaxID=6728 RepID=UPI003741F2C5